MPLVLFLSQSGPPFQDQRLWGLHIKKLPFFHWTDGAWVADGEDMGISRSSPSQTSQGEMGHTSVALCNGAPTPTLRLQLQLLLSSCWFNDLLSHCLFCSSSDPPWMFLPWGLHLCCLPCLLPRSYLAGSWSSLSSLLKYQPCPLCTLLKTVLFPQVTSVTLLYIHRAPIAI